MPGPAPSIDREAFRAAHAEGLLDVEIAHEFAANVDYVGRLRRRMGLPRNYRPPASPEQLAQARALLECGASRQDVAETVGLHKETLAAHLPGLAWTREEIGRHARLLARFPDVV